MMSILYEEESGDFTDYNGQQQQHLHPMSSNPLSLSTPNLTTLDSTRGGGGDDSLYDPRYGFEHRRGQPCIRRKSNRTLETLAQNSNCRSDGDQ